MYWTKIPTDLLTCRTPDIEILSIVKYQLLWAEHEQQPTDEIALRYLTPKQLSHAKKWLHSIESQVVSDIKSVESNRKYRRINYNKNKDLKENVSGTVTHTVSGTVSSSVDKVEEDKNRKEKEIYKESFEEWWSFFPKQRAGSKSEAYKKYVQVITKEHISPQDLLQRVKIYAASDEVKRGYASGAVRYFNDCKYNNIYGGAVKTTNSIPADIDLYDGKYFDFNLNRVVATKEDNPDWSKYNRATGEFDL